MNDYRINFQLPAQPLGEAIKPEKPRAAPRETVEQWIFREFDLPAWIDGEPVGITEEDCRQIKGAAQAMPASDEVAPSARPDSPVAAPPQSKWTPKVGARAMFDDDGGWVEDEVIEIIESPIKGSLYRGEHHIILRHLGEVIYADHEIRPISTSSDSDGWVEHVVGPCPLPMGARYECRTGDGDTLKSTVDELDMLPSSFWNPQHHENADVCRYCVVAYRILP